MVDVVPVGHQASRDFVGCCAGLCAAMDEFAGLCEPDAS
jgi:hypothetical protein